MSDNFNKKHIHIGNNYTSSEQYKYPRDVVITKKIAPRNRQFHGNKIKKQLEQIKENFNLRKEIELPEYILRDDALYVIFESEWDHSLNFEQLHHNTENPKYQILNVKKKNYGEGFRYEVALMLTEGGISHFLKKVESYLSENTKNREGKVTNTPKANELIANLETIKLATLKAFWTDEPEISFPNENESVWWEAWFRKTKINSKKLEDVKINLEVYDAEMSATIIEFPEHYVKLVKGTSQQLSESLMLLDNLAELRKPQELADLVIREDITLTEKEEWLIELEGRIEDHSNENTPLISIIDSGINNKHPLIEKFLPDERLHTWNPSWGKFDSVRNGGHGTGMAGLALYGDLMDLISNNDTVEIKYGLESFKIFHPDVDNDPEQYGAIYIYACSNSIVENPDSIKIFCLSVTNNYYNAKGRPSSSSAAIDKIAFGSFLDSNSPQLILVSGGNVELNAMREFPDQNCLTSVEDPGQAYNALTVGSYTRKDRINSSIWPGWKPLAKNGEMAPSNSTSLIWQSQWPNKPDIVMEGGNLAFINNDVDYKNSLQLLTTHKDYNLNIFQSFGDTSASVALAARLAAELRLEYLDYWPETIRGLIIHSAEWTEAMKVGIDFSKQNDRIKLLRTVGYGVPSLEKAKFSADNSLTLIAEKEIQPYRKEKSAVKYNEYHLYELPWPKDVLREELSENDVTLKVTLSYFIEPNPGERQYANNFRYHSHELDFKLIKPTEKLSEFKKRISAASSGTEENVDEKIRTTSELWMLRERVRSKGSAKKDFIQTSGADLSNRNILAVYPKNGWYRIRKKLGKLNSTVRYSLIVSIETSVTDIDIYSPVYNFVENFVEIPQYKN